jgi:SAM-dependent methyltransferase
VGLQEDLAAYYDAEARARRRTGRGALREGWRSSFEDRLRAGGCRTVLDVGAGPGVDTIPFRDAGFTVVAVDLGHENARLVRAAGGVAITASLFALPIRSRSFDAVWSMSTFVHVPHSRVDAALAEVLRPLRPEGVFGVGTWGGLDFEGVPEVGDLRPHRFFALHDHERWRRRLEQLGRVEHFEVAEPDPASGWSYQFAVVRV